MPRRPPPPPPDPVESAQAAGLRYVSDATAGIRRRRSGRGFSYVGSDGRTIRDQATLTRIRSLAIPPAYIDVWICPTANGHLQATGRDARGRKQYRYHPRWRVVRDETKFGRMLAFSEVLPRLRARVEQDLGAARPPPARRCSRRWSGSLSARPSAWATTSTRATTIPSGSPRCRTGTSRSPDPRCASSFRGKSGKTHRVALSDRRLARIVAALPGPPRRRSCSSTRTTRERRRAIGSGDVNDYLREITGEDFTAKDFRTWAGTLHAVEALEAVGPAPTQREAKAAVLKAIDRVAERLNNTRAVCRKYYVHPAVLETYEAGTLHDALQNGGPPRKSAASALSPEEQAVVRLLRHVA